VATFQRYMHDGLWYGITVQLMQTISTYYGAINIPFFEDLPRAGGFFDISNAIGPFPNSKLKQPFA
jgi:hypothetical protein